MSETSRKETLKKLKALRKSKPDSLAFVLADLTYKLAIRKRNRDA